jgi:hypothetical protein
VLARTLSTQDNWSQVVDARGVISVDIILPVYDGELADNPLIVTSYRIGVISKFSVDKFALY